MDVGSDASLDLIEGFAMDGSQRINQPPWASWNLLRQRGALPTWSAGMAETLAPDQ